MHRKLELGSAEMSDTCLAKIAKLGILLACAVSIAGCASSFGPDKTDPTGKNLAAYWGAPPDRDIYLVFSVLWSFEEAYEKLRDDAPEFADKKCGKSSTFTLTNFFIKGGEVRGLTGVSPIIAADIQCLNANQTDPNLVKTTAKQAEKRCEEIGLRPGSKFFRECVKGGTR